MTDLNPPPASLEEAMAHHGVKGMKWGVTTRRPTGAETHQARANVRAEKSAVKKQALKTLQSKGEARTLNQKKLDEMSKAFINNPDRVTASRMTIGEAVAVSLLATPALAGTLAVGAAARRRQIVKAQAKASDDN